MAQLKINGKPVRENSVLRVGEKEPYSYYYIDYKKRKGEGCFGEIFGAKKIEVVEKDNVKLSEEDYVIKLMDAQNTSPEQCERECQIQKGYIKTEESSGDFRGRYFIIMEDLGEQDFAQFKDKGLKKLNLRQRLHLLVSFLHTSNLWRLNTPTTGEPIYHLDIKYQNIVVKEMPLGSGMWEARPIDYGLAKRVEKEHDPDQMQGYADLGGTPAFTAPEVIGSAVGTRSDIFSMVPFVAMVLGADDPISKFSKFDMLELLQYRRVNKDEAKFKLNNLLENLIPKNFPEKDKLKESVKKVLEKMQDSYEKRPTMDQLLKFFNDFYTIMIAHDTGQQIVCGADKEDFSFPLQLSHDFPQNQGQPGNAAEIQQIHVAHGEPPKSPVPQKECHTVDSIHDNEFKTAIRNLQQVIQKTK